MTIQRAREILGKKGEKMTDEQISEYLRLIMILVNKAIDDAVGEKNNDRYIEPPIQIHL